WNSELGKAIFIVENGIYAMNFDGTSLAAPVKEPPVVASEIKGNNDKEIWANNFNMMYGNSGAVYVDGQLVTVFSRDEQSTVDEELFRVCKWNAVTGELLSTEIRPKSDHLESAGMAYNPKDGKVYGLFYMTGQDLPDEITSDPDYFEDQDADMTDGDAGYCLCTIDLQTMTVTPITPGLYYYNFVTFAINSDGRAFALTSGGANGVINDEGKMTDINGNLTGAQLCEFDLTTGLMKTKEGSYVDEEGVTQTEQVNIYDHGTGYCSQYRRQSACFSKSNPNIMYWNGYYNSGKGINSWGSWSSLSDKEWRTNGKYDTSLYAVDITTGEATRLDNIDSRWIFSALWVDGDDASDGAGIDVTAEPTTEAFIALSTADNGAIWQQVEKGQQYTYRLEPAIGWKVHSVTFNNQDITSQLTGGNTITTPVINAEYSTLFVTFEQEDATGVENQRKQVGEVRILGKEGGISVQNAKAGDTLQVYSADGQLLLSQRLGSGRDEVALVGKKLYIVKV
ncbi:MAG: hypothetical protein J5733_08685, partial [Bacteroidaceae bacterium]|nr:hypothetical protein [Bacteroidaceae bacterium]